MKNKKQKEEFTTFHLAFVGETVIITTNLTGQMTHNNESGTLTESFPVFYEGILLDLDEDFYYIGTPEEIQQAVRKTSVVHIMISSEKDVHDTILDNLAVPNRREDIN